MTPVEAWNGTKPSVHHFKVFGCIGFAHISDNRRKKLDNKAVKCVLLGVSEESKAYRLFDPVSKRIVVSRDVVFVENEGWKWGEVTEKKQDTPAFIDKEDDMLQTDKNPAESTMTAPENDNSLLQDEQTDSPQQGRIIRKPAYLQDYETGEELDVLDIAFLTQTKDPTCFEEAVKDTKWRNAMQLEIESIERNNTWELTTLLSGCKTIGVK